MDPRLSVFLNSFCFMIAGMMIVIIVMDALFPRRHSLGVFVAYTLVKGISWSWYDTAYFLGTVGRLEYGFQILAPAVFGALSFVVMYYTWKGSFAKFCVGSFCLDSMTGLVTMGVLFLAHEWFDTASAIDNRGYFGAGTVFSCVALVAIVLIMLWLAKPIVSWFRDYEIVHEKAWIALVVAGVVTSVVSRALSVEQLRDPMLLSTLAAALVIACFAVFLANQVRVQWKRRELLGSEAKLMREYDRAIREQVAYLQESSVQLDRLAEDASRLQGDVSNPELTERVAQLRDTCDALRHGVYSDCPALDVVLSVSQKEFEHLGLSVEYRVPPLGDASVQAALLAQPMLAWAAQTCGARGPKAESGQNAAEPDIAFRIMRGKGQLGFVLRMPSCGRSFPKSLMRDRVMTFDGVLLQADDGQRKTVRALVAEAT